MTAAALDVDPVDLVIFGGTIEDLRARRAKAAVRDDGRVPSSWSLVDMSTAVTDPAPDVVPTMMKMTTGKCLVYAGKVHWISGEPSSGKTWLALFAVAQAVRAGLLALIIDFEDTVRTTIKRLRTLGLHDSEIAANVRYISPTEALNDDGERALAAALDGVSLIIIDACSEAMSLAGLDPYSNPDTVTWFRFLYRLTDSGAAVVVLDHVVKNGDTRGNWAIGAQHKKGGLDGAAFVLTTVTAFSPEHDGRVRIAIAKDRHGLVGPVRHVVGEMCVETDEAGMLIEIRPVATTEDGGQLPTWYMQRVSEFLDGQVEPVSKTVTIAGVGGKAAVVRRAIDCLISEGYVKSEDGPRKAELVTLLKPYRDTNSAGTGSA